LEVATALDARSAIAHYQLGRLYKETHQLDHARTEFQKSSELQGGTAPSARPDP